jgi:hypothetical protein
MQCVGQFDFAADRAIETGGQQDVGAAELVAERVRATAQALFCRARLLCKSFACGSQRVRRFAVDIVQVFVYSVLASSSIMVKKHH